MNVVRTLVVLCAIASTAQAASPEPVGEKLKLVRLWTTADALAPPESVLDGKHLYLVSVFATWCEPCRKEIPIFKRLAAEFGKRGLEVIGISTDEKPPQAVVKWIKEQQIDYPVYYADLPIRKGTSILGDCSTLPTTLLVSRNGQVLRRWVGVVPERIFRATLKEATKPRKKR